jgi:hypothetical protein
VTRSRWLVRGLALPLLVVLAIAGARFGRQVSSFAALRRGACGRLVEAHEIEVALGVPVDRVVATAEGRACRTSFLDGRGELIARLAVAGRLPPTPTPPSQRLLRFARGTPVVLELFARAQAPRQRSVDQLFDLVASRVPELAQEIAEEGAR